MLGGVVVDAEGGVEDEGLGVVVADGGLVGEVVVGLQRVEGHLQPHVVAGQRPVHYLRDVYADLARHRYTNNPTKSRRKYLRN